MRSSDCLIAEICRVFAGQRAPVLANNIGDLHVGPEGTIIGFDQLLGYAAAASGRAAVRWTPATGTTQITPPGRATVTFSGPGPHHELAHVLPALVSALERLDHPTALIIDWADASITRPGEPLGTVGELLSSAATDPVLERAGHRLVIVDRSGTASGALGALPGLHCVNVNLPNHDERVAFLAHFQNVHITNTLAAIATDETVERVADAANGMSLRRLLSLMGELGYDGSDLTAAALAAAKHDFVVQHTNGALRPLSATRTLDEIAGLHNVRLMLERHAASNRPMRHFILGGPPGTGKSTVIAAIAEAMGRTAVTLGGLRDQFVGMSEQRTERMIQTAEAMSPMILFIEEIDQTLAGDDGPSGDSGVSKRINARLWEWTGEVSSRPGVLVIGATNKPSALGTRVRDRFAIVPILHPDPADALDILRITAARDGRTIDVDAAAAVLAANPMLRSGRTLAELAHNAGTSVDLSTGARNGHITGDALLLAMAETLPQSTDAEEELMALDAIRLTSHRSLLPWEAARIRGVRSEPPGYVIPYLNADGTFDLATLDARINQLRRHHG
jgi:hypothetical protein